MNKKKIASICVHNSCRGQVAETLGKHFTGKKFDFYPVGAETEPQVNEDATRIMKKLYRIDMEKEQYPKLISDIPTPDVTTSMGYDVGCSYMGRAFDDSWRLPDPTGESDSMFEAVIEEIEGRMSELPDTL